MRPRINAALYGVVLIQALLGIVLLILGAGLRGKLNSQLGPPIDAALGSIAGAGDSLYASADAMSGVGQSALSVAISLQSYQDAVGGLRQTVNDLYSLVGAYQQNLMDANATAIDVAKLCGNVSSGLRIKVPAGIHFQRFLPVVDWETPSSLSAAANEVDVIGNRVRATAESFEKTAQVLAAQRGNQARLNVAFDNTVLALQEAQKAARQFDDEKFKLAARNLRQAGDKLKLATENGTSIQQTLVQGINIVMVLGGLALVNAFIPVLLQSRNQRSETTN